MESRIQIENVEDIITLFGKFDENVKIIEQTFNVTIL